jgi:hypothetical protein
MDHAYKDPNKHYAKVVNTGLNQLTEGFKSLSKMVDSGSRD